MLKKATSRTKSVSSVITPKSHIMMASQQGGTAGSLALRPKNLAGAHKFYVRRRNGLERKVRDLITKAHTLYGVDVHVTTIYEFDDGAQTAMFRSHLEGRGRWWPTLDALKADCGPRTSGMIDLNKENLDLIGWAEFQQQRTTRVQPSAPEITEATTAELPEDILASTLPFDANGTYEDALAFDSSGNSSDDSQDDYSTPEEEGNGPSRPSKGYEKLQTQPRNYSTPQRGSPKRYREEEASQLQWTGQNPLAQPIFQPTFRNTYGYANVANSVPVASMYGTLPQGAPASGPMLSSIAENGPQMYNNSNFPTDLNMEQPYSDHISQASLLQRASKMPRVPQTKRTRKDKHRSSTRRSSIRRTTS